MARRGGNEPRESRDEQIQGLARAYAAALLAADEVAAELVIRDAVKAPLTTAEIDDEIIAPALWLVGELWERGEISVADEHVATEISLRVLALQREAQRVIHGRRGHRVMLALPAGEQHAVALRMAESLLRAAGYDVIMLGADVPPAALAVAAVRHRPEVICLSSTVPGGADQLLIAIHAIQRRWTGAGFIVGGQALSSRVRGIPGIDAEDHVGDVVEAVDAMIRRPDRN